jgi:TRAP-type transport system periplasmic protein
MQIMYRKIAIGTMLVGLTLGASFAYAQNQSDAKVLKFNHTDTPSGTRHVAAELFAKRVNEYTGGKVRVMVFHSGQLGNDPQSIKQVSEGKLDFTLSSTGSYASLVTELNLTALPYLVTSYEEGWRFYDTSPWLRQQFDKLPAKGMRRIATWESGFRSFTTRSPLVNPSDAKGKKIRIYANEMLKWVMESIGYETVVMPVTEVYAAIQQGKVDGQENPIDTIRALRFYEVAPNVVLTQHVYGPLPLVISESTWSKLSSSERSAVSKAAIEAQQVSRTLVQQADERNLQAMTAAGAKITRPDIDLFRKAMEQVYAKAEKVYGSDVATIIQEARSNSKSSAK